MARKIRKEYMRSAIFRAIVGIAAAYFAGQFMQGYIGGLGDTMLTVGYTEAGAGYSTFVQTGLSTAGKVLVGATGGFAGGLASSGGDLKAAFQGAVTGGAFGYVGTFSNPLANYAGHALVGCASGAMNGGGGEGCARGAVSQVLSKWVTVETRGLDSKPLQFAVATMTGGAVSAISGGKFATGAQTAAFGYLFNELARLTTNSQRGYSDYQHSRLSNGELLVQSLTKDGDVIAQVLVRAGKDLSLSAIDSLMEVSRAANGAIVDVISGVRSAAEQQREIDAGNPRAAKTSQHTIGIAADFRVLGMSTSDAAALAYKTDLFPRVNLYKQSNGAVHIDYLRNQRGSTYFVDWIPKKCCE